MKKDHLPLMVRLKGGIFGGFITAIIMAGFDFADGLPFSLMKFVLFFCISGLILGLIIRPNENYKN